MHHTKPRYHVEEAFELLGLPRSSGYERIRQGALRTQRDGRRCYVTADEIDRYVRTQDQRPA